MQILGIDPGQYESAYLLWDCEKNKVLKMGIEKNESIENSMILHNIDINLYGIETVVSYGMPVGKSTFETCFWIGEFRQILKHNFKKFKLVEKPDIRLHFCNSRRAKDGNINRVLLDRFGEKGTKKNPGVLYGVKTHIWSALAVVIYLMDNYYNKENIND